MTNDTRTTAMNAPPSAIAAEHDIATRGRRWWRNVRAFLTFMLVAYLVALISLGIAALTAASALVPNVSGRVAWEVFAMPSVLISTAVVTILMLMPAWFLWLCRKFAVNSVADASDTLKRLETGNASTPR